MRILVSGSSGLVGRAVSADLSLRGHRVGRLVRGTTSVPGDVLWDPAAGRFDSGAAEGTDAVVHLAGENISSRRWTDGQKRRIRDSRIEGTALLARSLLALPHPPSIVIAASAIGFYGDTGDRAVDEASPPGTGFLADVCRAWEAAARPLADGGVRLVTLRLGVVLGTRGGALAQMLPLFRVGLGGRIGNGRQWMSWITLGEVVGIVSFALGNGDLRGPVNAVAPEPVRNSDFTAALGKALGRPTLLAVPAIALRLALGEMADALLLSSSRVSPAVLPRCGYRFTHPELEGALRSLLG